MSRPLAPDAALEADPGGMALEGGFADLAVDAAGAFRAIMETLARPGRIVTLAGARPPAPLSVAAGTAILTLCDAATPLHLAPGLDTPAVRDWIAFHTGAPAAPAEDAAFAVGVWPELVPLGRYATGTPDYPDRSATLIVELPDLRAEGVALAGPGIDGAARLSLPPDLVAARAAVLRYPLGIDLILTCGDRMAALPRSTRVG